jgi:hypothetical protein
VSYSYIDVNYVNTDLENGPSGDGFGIRGSVAFGGNYFVFAEYTTLDFENVDADQYAVGLGGHMEMTSEIDLTGRIGYVEADLSGDGGLGGSDDGYMASLGVRGRRRVRDRRRRAELHRRHPLHVLTPSRIGRGSPADARKQQRSSRYFAPNTARFSHSTADLLKPVTITRRCAVRARRGYLTSHY